MNANLIDVVLVLVLVVSILYIFLPRGKMVKKHLTYDMLKDYLGGKIVYVESGSSGTIKRLQSKPCGEVVIFYSTEDGDSSITLDCKNFRHDTVGLKRYITNQDSNELFYLEKPNG